MKFQKGTRRKPLEYEKDLINYWNKNQIFRKSVQQRPDENAFVFYDGPPFLTGTPHHGHLLVSSVKDAIGRFQTMQGKKVERRWGWDCHGLPAEVFVEKQLGIKSKKEIGTKISIPEYVKACRAAMVKTGTEWEDTIERIGRWVEFKGAYKTMDAEFMESVWWAFKTLYDKGSIYEGEKILVYCTKDATPISKSEVAMENSYQTITDPSVFVYFDLEDSDESLLAWTTTPWTLPANVAIAVNEDIDYSLVEYGGKKVYIAKDAIDRVLTDEKHQKLDYSVVKNIKGKKLVGKRYKPLFENHGPSAHHVLAADFVTADEGTGIVHEAPAYGEDDYELCKSLGLPIVSIVDENGHYTQGRWQGENIWEVNKQIAKTLVAEGRALKVDYIQHEYPHCHRCGTRLMYRAHPSWFMDIQSQKVEMIDATSKTSWTPKHLQTGRFKHILETAPDWNLSRDRYWATPIPVWRGVREDGTEVVKVIGSYKEFKDLTGKTLNDYHLPNVMDTTFNIDGTELHHIGKVLDCWFESGSMPFAQFHYPFENKDKFESSFPADFIIEAIDQTRGWFYSLTAVNVALFGKSPYKNLICTGFIKASDGRKMSKKLKNYTDPMKLMDQYSADSFRFLMLGSPLLSGEDFNLSDRDVADVSRKLNMIWNMYDFFTLYADVDGWEWDGELNDPMDSLTNPLDRWVVSRIHQLTEDVSNGLNTYNLPQAISGILPFIDDASNWYVRRSRKRFWKTEDDGDKSDAYKTLHYILTRLATITAPITPFLAEELYRKLTSEESVHLVDWPKPGQVDREVIARMAAVREFITTGLAQRAEAGIKVRQPLSEAVVFYPEPELLEELHDVLKEELNVKAVIFTKDSNSKIDLNTELDTALMREGFSREIIRQVQNARKASGLDVDDRISLHLNSKDAELLTAIEAHSEAIQRETLAVNMEINSVDSNYSKVEVEGAKLEISFKKAH